VVSFGVAETDVGRYGVDVHHVIPDREG